MDQDDRPFFFRLSRLGLPAIILIFYSTSVTAFSFTPDSAFIPLQWVQNLVAGQGFEGFVSLPSAGSPSPLWVFLVSLGASFKLDPVLLAKILSLFFSCLVLLLSYLVTYEMTDNPLMGFCVALVAATSGWLLQASPSGMPCTLLGTLLLATVYCMLRRETILVAVMLGLSCLMAWQSVVLLVPLVLDFWLSDLSQPGRLRRLTLSYMILTALLLPWVLYAHAHRIPWWPEGLPSGFSTGSSPYALIAIGVLVAGVVGETMVLALHRDRADSLGKRHVGVLVWIAWLAVVSVMGDGGFFLGLLPLLAAYAMLFLRVVMRMLGRADSTAMAILVLSACLMVLQQFDFSRVRQAMTDTQESVPVLTELSYWMRSSVPADATVASEWPGLVGYVAARPVTALQKGGQPTTEYAVTAEREMPGYRPIYSAAKPFEAVPGIEQFRYLIWKRQ